jgi:hypothetical protein
MFHSMLGADVGALQLILTAFDIFSRLEMRVSDARIRIRGHGMSQLYTYPVAVQSPSCSVSIALSLSDDQHGTVCWWCSAGDEQQVTMSTQQSAGDDHLMNRRMTVNG